MLSMETKHTKIPYIETNFTTQYLYHMHMDQVCTDFTDNFEKQNPDS